MYVLHSESWWEELGIGSTYHYGVELLIIPEDWLRSLQGYLSWAWVRRVLDAWTGRIQSILICAWNLIFLSTLGNLSTLGTLGTLFSTPMLRAWIWHVVDIRAELLQRTGQAQQMQMHLHLHLHLHLSRKTNIVIPRQRKLASWFGRYLHVLNLAHFRISIPDDMFLWVTCISFPEGWESSESLSSPHARCDMIFLLIPSEGQDITPEKSKDNDANP